MIAGNNVDMLIANERTYTANYDVSLKCKQDNFAELCWSERDGCTPTQVICDKWQLSIIDACLGEMF